MRKSVLTGIAFGLLALAFIVTAQMKYSQYPNRATLNPTDILLFAEPGVTNFNMTWAQLQNLITNQDTMNITNLYADYFYPSNWIMGSNGNVLYTLATNVPTSTNITLDFNQSMQTINLTASARFLQTTNRPTYSTNVVFTTLIVRNYSGGNLVLNTNATVAWKIDGTAFPYTVTNLTETAFTWWAVGDNETNVHLGSRWFK